MNATFTMGDQRWDVTIVNRLDGSVDGVFLHFQDLRWHMPKVDVSVIDLDTFLKPDIVNRDTAITCSSGVLGAGFSKVLAKAEQVRMSLLVAYTCNQATDKQLMKVAKRCFRGWACDDK